MPPQEVVTPAIIREGADKIPELLNRLLQLSREAEVLQKQGGKNRLERVQLCAALLENKQWLKQNKFDEAKGIEYLERKYFSDLEDVISLNKLLAIYRWKPDEAWWEECKHNLKIIVRKFEDRQQPPPENRGTETGTGGNGHIDRAAIPASEVNKIKEKFLNDIKHHVAVNKNLKKELGKREETISRMDKTIQEVKKDQKTAQEEAKELRAEVTRLNKELAAARKRIEELEELLKAKG